MSAGFNFFFISHLANNLIAAYEWFLDIGAHIKIIHPISKKSLKVPLGTIDVLTPGFNRGIRISQRDDRYYSQVAGPNCFRKRVFIKCQIQSFF